MSSPLFPGCRLAVLCLCVSLCACLWMCVDLSACSRPFYFLCLCWCVVVGTFGLTSPGACTLCGLGPSASAAHLSASLSPDGGPPLSYSSTLAAGSAVAAMVHAAVAIGASALVIDEMAAATITLLGKVEAASLRPAASNIIAAVSAIDFQSVGPPTVQGVAQLRRCGACHLPQATHPPVDGGKAPAQSLPSLGTVSPRPGGSSLSGALRVGSVAALTHAHQVICSPVHSQLAGIADVVATNHPVDCFPVRRLRPPCASLCVQPPLVQHGMPASAAPLDGASGTFPGTHWDGSVAARAHAHRVVCSPDISQDAGSAVVVATTHLVDCHPVQRLLPPCATLCLQPPLVQHGLSAPAAPLDGTSGIIPSNRAAGSLTVSLPQPGGSRLLSLSAPAALSFQQQQQLQRLLQRQQQQQRLQHSSFYSGSCCSSGMQGAVSDGHDPPGNISSFHGPPDIHGVQSGTRCGASLCPLDTSLSTLDVSAVVTADGPPRHQVQLPNAHSGQSSHVEAEDTLSCAGLSVFEASPPPVGATRPLQEAFPSSASGALLSLDGLPPLSIGVIQEATWDITVAASTAPTKEGPRQLPVPLPLVQSSPTAHGEAVFVLVGAGPSPEEASQPPQDSGLGKVLHRLSHPVAPCPAGPVLAVVAQLARLECCFPVKGISAPLLEPPPVPAVLQEVVLPASPIADVALGASWSPLEADPPSSSFTPLPGEAGCPSYFIQVSPRQQRLQRRGQRLLLAQLRSGVPSPDQVGFQAAMLTAFG